MRLQCEHHQKFMRRRTLVLLPTLSLCLLLPFSLPLFLALTCPWPALSTRAVSTLHTTLPRLSCPTLARPAHSIQHASARPTSPSHCASGANCHL